MSYPVPDKFADNYIESRLCPSVTNVTINVVDGELAPGSGRRRQPWTEEGDHTGGAEPAWAPPPCASSLHHM